MRENRKPGVSPRFLVATIQWRGQEARRSLLRGKKALYRDDNGKGPGLRYGCPRPGQEQCTWKERSGFKRFLKKSPSRGEISGTQKLKKCHRGSNWIHITQVMLQEEMKRNNINNIVGTEPE